MVHTPIAEVFKATEDLFPGVPQLSTITLNE
jgi:hypothetical protein